MGSRFRASPRQSAVRRSTGWDRRRRTALARARTRRVPAARRRDRACRSGIAWARRRWHVRVRRLSPSRGSCRRPVCSRRGARRHPQRLMAHSERVRGVKSVAAGKVVVMPANVAVAIELSEERAQLEAWTRRPTSAQALAQRSRIVLLDGRRVWATPRSLSAMAIGYATWRPSGVLRFAAHRLDGLRRRAASRPATDDERRAGRSGHQRPRWIQTPKDATQWSTRSLAKELGLTQTAVFADLARVRAPAAPPGHVQALHGPVLRGQDPRRRRALSATRPSAPSCSVSTSSPRSRRWTGPLPMLPMLPRRP